MNIYKNPESDLGNGEDEIKISKKGSMVSKVSLGTAIFLLLFKFAFFQFTDFSPLVVAVIGLLIFVLQIIGLICGILGLFGYFKSKNKLTLLYSLIGIAIATYYLSIIVLYTIDSMQKFNAARI